MVDALDISLVVPVHNEAATIAPSVQSWLEVFRATGLRAEIVIVDDGSTDGTGDVLATLAKGHRSLRILQQRQAGHGAAVVAGYRAARGTWVMQVDGDDEIGAEHFAALWGARLAEGLVLGRRDAALRPGVRRVITACAAAGVRVASSTRVHDPNVPFRLLSRRRLDEFLEVLPAGLFAPNLAMSLYAAQRGWPLAEVPVVERPRVATRQPLGGMRLWRAVFRTVRQSIAFGRTMRRQSRRS